MISRPKKSRAGSIVSSSVRKLSRGPTKEEVVSRKILEHFREKSFRIARDVEPALYDKEFNLYLKAKQPYIWQVATIKSRRDRCLASTTKRKKKEKLQKLSGERFRISVKIMIDTIKLAMPYYYESDLYRYISLSKLNSEKTLAKLEDLLHSPFRYSVSFVLRVLTGLSISQLNNTHASRAVPVLFALSRKPTVEVDLRVLFPQRKTAIGTSCGCGLRNASERRNSQSLEGRGCRIPPGSAQRIAFAVTGTGRELCKTANHVGDEEGDGGGETAGGTAAGVQEGVRKFGKASHECDGR